LNNPGITQTPPSTFISLLFPFFASTFVQCLQENMRMAPLVAAFSRRLWSQHLWPAFVRALLSVTANAIGTASTPSLSQQKTVATKPRPAANILRAGYPLFSPTVGYQPVIFRSERAAARHFRFFGRFVGRVAIGFASRKKLHLKKENRPC
jgi:hypothetical protein